MSESWKNGIIGTMQQNGCKHTGGNEYETDEVKNMDDNEKKEIVNQILDKIYPKMGIKRCMQINRNNKIKLQKFSKDFKKSFLQKGFL